jgi:hypothetical protein
LLVHRYAEQAPRGQWPEQHLDSVLAAAVLRDGVPLVHPGNERTHGQRLPMGRVGHARDLDRIAEADDEDDTTVRDLSPPDDLATPLFAATVARHITGECAVCRAAGHLPPLTIGGMRRQLDRPRAHGVRMAADARTASGT